MNSEELISTWNKILNGLSEQDYPKVIPVNSFAWREYRRSLMSRDQLAMADIEERINGNRS